MKRLSRVLATLALCFASRAIAGETTNEAPAPKKPDLVSTRLRLDMGFAHWFGDSFRAAQTGTDLGFGVGFRPWFRFVEIQARYEYSKVRVDEGHAYYDDFHDRRVHFWNFGIAPCDDFRLRNRFVTVSYTGGVVLASFAGHGIATGAYGGFRTEYLFGVASGFTKMGLFVDLRRQIYNISGRDVPLREWVSFDKPNLECDGSVCVGFVMTLF
jgi:hypothetical protein